jgi:hypothetical protein
MPPNPSWFAGRDNVIRLPAARTCSSPNSRDKANTPQINDIAEQPGPATP